MKIKRTHRSIAQIGGLALVGALALAACGSDNTSTSNSGSTSIGGAACAKGTAMASGSSAQANAMQAWIAKYQSACSGATINYQSVGSGAGIQAFTAGQTSFAGSDSALKPDEHTSADSRCKTGKAVDLPMVPGPIAVAYNLPGVDKLVLTPKVLAGIFSGKITKWNDPAITAINSGAKLPSTGIQAFHRGDSSGTTDNFTKYLTAAAGSDWTYDSGKEWKAPGGQGAKGSEGVTQGVKSTEGAITYTEYSYAKNGNLGVAQIDNGGGPVELTPTNVGNAVADAKVVGTGDDLSLQLNYATKTAGAYPILLVTYEITCEQGLSADQAKLVKSFLGYTASADGQALLTDLGYAPLPKTIQDKVTTVVGKIS